MIEISPKTIKYKNIDDKKIYFINGKQEGEEYELVKKLIGRGMSSSNAHKILKKAKMIKE